MSIENSIDRLAAAIEKLSTVFSPEAGIPVRVEPRPATEQEKAEFAAADAAAAKKPRGRPRKQGNIEIISQEGVTVEVRPLVAQDPQPAAQTADTATEEATATAAATGNTQTSATAPSTTTTTGPAETISKGDIVQILTGLQKKLEESATSIEEKRGAAQKCRDLIKSVVGSESLKDAKPEHFGRIKSAVLKVLNNE